MEHQVVMSGVGDDDQFFVWGGAGVEQGLAIGNRDKEIFLTMDKEGFGVDGAHFFEAAEPHGFTGSLKRKSPQSLDQGESEGKSTFEDESLDFFGTAKGDFDGCGTPHGSAHDEQVLQFEVMFGQGGFQDIDDGYGIVQKGLSGGQTGAQTVTPKIDDEEMNTHLGIKCGNIVIIGSNFPVAMPIEQEWSIFIVCRVKSSPKSCLIIYGEAEFNGHLGWGVAMFAPGVKQDVRDLGMVDDGGVVHGEAPGTWWNGADVGCNEKSMASVQPG